MSWDDIDFDLIVPGMITRGPAEVSIAEYLQQFSTALDERWNMVERDLINNPIPGIEFQAGEIRNNTFWDKFRDLIVGYNELWFTRAYFDNEVLTNPTNWPTLRLNNADLEAALGPEAWDILTNGSIQTRPFSEIWKASILQGFFTIYEFTNVVADTSTSAASAAQNKPTIIDGTSNYFEASKVVGALGDSYATVLSNLNWVAGGDISLLALFEFNATRENIAGQVRWQIRRAGDTARPTIRNKNGFDVALLCKDLDDNILTMDFVSVANMSRNSSIAATYADRQYTTDIALNTGGTILIESPIISTAQDANGTVQKMGLSDGVPLGPITLNDETSDLSTFVESQRVIISPPSFYFMDINNPALEYFIDP